MTSLNTDVAVAQIAPPKYFASVCGHFIGMH